MEPCVRSSKKGGLGLVPLTLQNKVHSPVAGAGGRESQTVLQMPPALPPTKGVGRGMEHTMASPIPRIGRGNPDRKSSFCPGRSSSSARVWERERGRRRKRLPESFPAPSQRPVRDSQGTPPGPSPGTPTLQQPSLQTLVWWGSPEGVTLVSCKRGPGDPVAPRQTKEEGAKDRKEGGSLPVVFTCR